jgi:Xaa-Pro aminopeptidase
LELPEIEKLWSKLVHEDSLLCLTGLGGPELESLKLSIPEKAKVESASPALALARVRKDPAELALIREAINVTAQAQLQAMASVRPDQYEFELQAVVEYVFRRLGAQRPAFRSIVGSGRRACILHYNANDGLMKAGELVIVDVGARLHGYCADITRTIPVSGRFTGRQREIYELVLAAQAAALAAVKPGAKLADIHQAAAESFEQAGYRAYFPHGHLTLAWDRDS